MGALDQAAELLRIAEHYRQMKDEELLILSRQHSQLTEAAQQALTSETRCRGLKLEAEMPEPEPAPVILREPASDVPGNESEEDDPYAEDRTLVEIRQVWSLRDALQLQWLLDRAGIPFFMGPEKATGVDNVTSDIAKGVSVQIMRIGWYWAQQALKDYEPADEPPVPTEEKEEAKEIPVRCPKCQSTDVVFIDLKGNQCASKPCFRWVCDACGHRWQDDGLVKE